MQKVNKVRKNRNVKQHNHEVTNVIDKYTTMLIVKLGHIIRLEVSNLNTTIEHVSKNLSKKKKVIDGLLYIGCYMVR